MAHPKSRWQKGSPETQARMAELSQKAKEAREARDSVPPEPPQPVVDRKPFVNRVHSGVDVNEFTGINKGFPQQQFGVDIVSERPRTQAWPGDRSK